MSDREITRAEFFGGFTFFTVQLFLSFALVWSNLNATVILGGLTDYYQVTWIALLVAFLNTVVLAVAGDRLVFKILPTIGLWVLVGVVGYYLGFFTVNLVWAETLIVATVAVAVGFFHWILT